MAALIKPFLLVLLVALLLPMIEGADYDKKKTKPAYVHKPPHFPHHGVDPQSTQYVMIRKSSNPHVREKARCLAHNKCYLKTLTCPRQCPKRKNSKHHHHHHQSAAAGCFIDCSRKCQATCKHRKPNCHGYSSVCYDPRFVGGDGIMFYFHGKAGDDFCLVSDRHLHVNARFIGIRPQGRTRDFTWVQALGIMFDNHKFSVAAKRVAKWEEGEDQLAFTYDGQEVTVPRGESTTWSSPMEEVRVERVAETNSVEVIIDGVMGVNVEVVPITEEEDRVHGYGLPADDCFAHLNVQFSFNELSSTVDGVLGQTYQPDFKNPVKVGVPMPVMGGETKFKASSLFATDCLANKFAQPSALAAGVATPLAMPTGFLGAQCTSTSSAGGIVCRR